MTARPDAPPHPPRPPTIRRRLQLGRVQWIGAPLLLVVPVLAMLGVFGERQGRATARGADVELEVGWPTRTRHEMIHRLDVVVRNVSARPLDTLTVAIDSGYLAAFSAVSVTPGATHAWEVELTDVRPGEARHVVVALDAQAYGRRRGAVTAAAGADTARVAIGTLVFP